MHQAQENEKAAADFLCQIVRTIQKWLVTGYGPRFFKFGHSVWYRRSVLLEWVEEQTRRHTSQT
mgnify:CR=1 FL=1